MTLEKTKEAFCPRFLLGFPAPLPPGMIYGYHRIVRNFGKVKGRGGRGEGGGGLPATE